MRNQELAQVRVDAEQEIHALAAMQQACHVLQEDLEQSKVGFMWSGVVWRGVAWRRRLFLLVSFLPDMIR